MRYEVDHHGTPVGHAEFVAQGLVVAELEPTAGYSAVRGSIRAASEILWQMGFFGIRGANPAAIPENLLADAASLEFEIRDSRGNQLQPDWINIIERPGPAPVPALVARFSLELARYPASRSQLAAGERNRDRMPNVRCTRQRFVRKVSIQRTAVPMSRTAARPLDRRR